MIAHARRAFRHRLVLALLVLPSATMADAVAQEIRPELVLQSGHSESVNALAFTPDDRYLVSGSHDHSVRLWEVGSGKVVRVLGHHSREVLALAMCPDGRCVASGGEDMLVHLWELPSGRLLRSFRGHTEGVQGLAITKDGRYLISGAGNAPDWDVGRSPDYTVRVWDLHSGRLVRRLKGHTQLIKSIALDEPSGLVVSGSFDGTVKIWDVAAGRLQQTLGGFPGQVTASFSPDGIHVVTASKRAVELVNRSSGSVVATLARSPRPYRVAVSGNGFAAFPSDAGVGLIDLRERKLLATLEGGSGVDRGKNGQSLAFSRQGDLLAVGYGDGLIIFWNVKSRRLVSELRGYTVPLRTVAVGRTGRWIATSTDEAGPVRIWDTELGRLSRSLRPQNRIAFALAFDDRGNRLAVSGGGHTEEVKARPVEIWDLDSDQQIALLSHDVKRVEFLKWSQDGRCLGASGDGTTTIFDVASRRSIVQIDPAGRVVEFARQCQWVATGSRANDLSYWELPSGRLLNRRQGVGWASVMDSGRTALGSLGWQSDFKVLELASGKWLQFRGHRDYVSDITFADDDNLVASASWDGDIKIWNKHTARLTRTFESRSGGMSVSFLPGSREFIAGYRDGSARIWDVGSGEEILALVSFRGSDDWLVVAPDGLFDGTAGAMERVAWRLPGSDDAVPLEVLFNDFYRPGLLGEVFAGARPHAVLDIAAMVRVPGLRRMLQDRLAHLELRSGRAVVCFADVPGVAVGSAVGENDVPSRRQGFEVVPEDVTCKYQLELPISGIEATRLLEALKTPARPESVGSGVTVAPTVSSTLHVLTIGVGGYQARSGLGPLPYAVPSARALEGFFAGQARKQAGAYARIRVWPGLYDADATRDAIGRKLREIGTTAGPNDVLFLYLVGHGVAPAGQEMFSFVPFDGDVDAIRETGLTTAMLAEQLRSAEFRKFVIAIDTCQAGAVVEALARVGGEKARVARLESRIQGGGGHVIAAALPLAYAAQVSSAKRSLLASVLLEGLRRHGGAVRISEVVAYVRDRLPAVSEKEIRFRQVPLTASAGADFNIAVN